MLSPKQFSELNKELSALTTDQANITCTVRQEWAKTGLPDRDKLNEIKDRLLESNLRVLVMGRFSSGKSTFLNALMGANFLPAKAIPTTAVIGEIKYDVKPSATLHPKKGTPEYAKGKINIKVEDLGKYIVINHNDDDSDEERPLTPWEKVEIFYPLNACKLGVEFVDSPGLDDPTCHDKITKDYLPSADAIIYCMNTQNAFSAFDKAQIEYLRSLGYKTIIFVFTYFDMLEQNDMLRGSNEAEDTRRHYTDALEPYTDLGRDGIFFVGSLPALIGKLKGNNALLESSHFPMLEKRLEQILFNERGRIKLIKAIQGVKGINKDTARFLKDAIDLGKTDKCKLADRLNEAQSNLSKAIEKANLISSTFAKGLENVIEGSKTRARQFMSTEVIPNIEKWVMEFKPTKEQEISMWHPKRTAKVFTEACMKFFQTKLETAIAKWCTEDLVPKYIIPNIEALAKQQNQSLEAYENDLKNVRGSLAMPEAPAEEGVSGSSRILSAITGLLLLNPVAAFNGGMLGWSGMTSTIVATIVANIVLYIIALCTGPIGLTAVVFTNILVLFTGSVVATSGMETKTKKKIAKAVIDELTKHQEDLAHSVGDSVKDVTDKIATAVGDELRAPIAQYHDLMNQASEDITSKGSDLDMKLCTMGTMLRDNEKIADKLDDYANRLIL